MHLTIVLPKAALHKVKSLIKFTPPWKYLNVGSYALTTFKLMTNLNKKLTTEEQRLPKHILDKALKSSGEYGWRQQDFSEVIEAARKAKLAIIGGQVQYVLPDGTCELYWLSYDPADRHINEPWLTYCDRSAKECLQKFNKLIATTNIEAEALVNFPFLLDKKENGIDISKFLVFILYFDSKETDLQ